MLSLIDELLAAAQALRCVYVQVIKEQDRIDILVNNAGVAGEFCPLADADPDMVKLVGDTFKWLLRRPWSQGSNQPRCAHSRR